MTSLRSHRNRLLPALLLLLPAILLVLPTEADAQRIVLPGTNVGTLLDLSQRYAEELEAGRPALYHELLTRKGGPQGRLNADANIRLQFIAPNGMPMFTELHNINAARTLSVDDVWPGGIAGFNLSGSGTSLGRLAIWDGGGVRVSHQEFGGRATQMDAVSGTHYHATHVAGTMIGAGVDGNAKGMSFQGTLACYDWNGDDSEMAAAAASGMNASNHSYGYITGWYNSSGTWYWYGDVGVSETEDYGFGFYDEMARSDEIAYNAPYYTIVKSAGNERDDAGPGPGGGHYYWDPNTFDWEWSTATRDPDGGTSGYDCMTWNANAKNILAIGAVNDIPGGYSVPGDVVTAAFSSWGPADDGRVKPDFVANGVSLYSTHNSGDNQYATYSGTSMSSPNTSGTVNLLIRYYEASHGATPRAATMKSILMQTADEAGPVSGPDYSFGWGLINARKAVELIHADSSQAGRVREEALANGETDEFTFTLGSAAPVRVSIAWTDPPGTPTVPAVDPTTLMLVNDLDLRLERIGGSTYLPYVLNPANPSFGASTGDNVRDNAEQVYVALAPAGTYSVRITHEGTIAAPQAYSIASTHDLGVGTPPVSPGVVASDTSYSHVYVEWNAVAGADSYEVKRDAAVLATVDASVVSWRDTIAAGTYSYQVRAGNEFGWSAPGSDNGTVLAVPPNWVDVASGPLAASDSTFGAAWGDYDGDDDLDIFLANRGGPDRLLRNDGGAFVDVTAAPLGGSGNGTGVSWGDYDNDDILDLYVANDGANALYHGLGGGAFEDVTVGVLGDAGDCRSAPWCDFEGDRRLDLFLVNHGSADRLLRNGLPGPFADVTAPPLGDAGNGSAAAWGDYDNDGDDDVYLTHETIGASRLYRNDGFGNFADATAGPLVGGAAGSMASWGDYDNDGDLDLYRVGAAPGTSELLRNDGGGTFAAVAGGPSNGATGRSAAWGDVDNDGDLDLYVGCDGPNRLYRNDGGGVFVEIEAGTLGDAGDARAVAFADFDSDGDLDLLVANGDGPNRLFRNDISNGNHKLLVRLTGTASNRVAIGARLRLVAGGVVQIREISGGEGSGQGSLTAEFGLGSTVFADSLTIYWPSGFVQVLPGPMASGSHWIIEPQISTDVTASGAPREYRLLPNTPNPFNPTTRIAFEVPRAERVNMTVFDVKGRAIAVLTDGAYSAGRFDLVWDGTDKAGRGVPSGIYFARMTAGSFAGVRRLVLLR